eukprot:Pgem_evm1s6310
MLDEREERKKKNELILEDRKEEKRKNELLQAIDKYRLPTLRDVNEGVILTERNRFNEIKRNSDRSYSLYTLDYDDDDDESQKFKKRLSIFQEIN